jgi:hypothetical protein
LVRPEQSGGIANQNLLRLPTLHGGPGLKKELPTEIVEIYCLNERLQIWDFSVRKKRRSGIKN